MKISVKPTPWENGWELEIAPDQYTQVEKLADAKKQVIDYLDTVDPTQNHSNCDIQIFSKENIPANPLLKFLLNKAVTRHIHQPETEKQLVHSNKFFALKLNEAPKNFRAQNT